MEQGHAASLEEAQGLIRAGKVHGESRRYEKPGESVPANTLLRLKRDPRRYVSRGGEKLEGALTAFGVDPAGLLCLDLGASTGGFTHCLLERGARHVVAVDSGTNQLALVLRSDPRVTCREKTRFRDLSPGDFPAPPKLIVADLSFISLRQAVPVVAELLSPEGEAVLLVKPQFELPPSHIPVGGVVEEMEDRRKAVESVLDSARACGLAPRGVVSAEPKGADGNQEYFVHLSRIDGRVGDPIALDAIFA